MLFGKGTLQNAQQLTWGDVSPSITWLGSSPMEGNNTVTEDAGLFTVTVFNLVHLDLRRRSHALLEACSLAN